MKITLRRLRQIIREAGLDADMRNMAGSVGVGGFGISMPHRDKETSMMNPPPGLGDERSDEDTTEDDAQEKSQPAARVDARSGHAR